LQLAREHTFTKNSNATVSRIIHEIEAKGWHRELLAQNDQWGTERGWELGVVLASWSRGNVVWRR
jgi:hypothetical protein